MNKILTADKRSQAIMENTITSFNEAGKSGVRFVEFDVQVKAGAANLFLKDPS